MRYPVLVLFIFSLAAAGISDLQAQSMHVKDTADNQTNYSLSHIASLHFLPGELRIKLADNSSDAYTLGSLRYLIFSDSTQVRIDPEETVNHLIKIYPNPVIRELKIDLSATALPGGTLDIMSIDGKLINTQQLSGSGIFTVDMSQLRKGIYICRFRNQTEQRIIKVCKQ
jgi:hypothetical protein